MRLFEMLMNRERKFKTWVSDDDYDGERIKEYYDGYYIHGEYKISLFDIFSEYIMWDILNMDYYLTHNEGLSFRKVYRLSDLLDEPKKVSWDDLPEHEKW